MKNKENIVISLKYLFIAIAINLITVLLHEIGHAFIYWLQGYSMDFHLTSVEAINGTETILGAAGGILLNIIIASLFLFLFIRYKSIYLFSVVAANTLFVRIIVYILGLLRGIAPTDETFIGDAMSVNPVIIAILGLIIMTSIFISGVKVLIRANKKDYSKLILVMTFISSIVSLFILISLEKKGI